jgi:hypothetical protein
VTGCLFLIMRQRLKWFDLFAPTIYRPCFNHVAQSKLAALQNEADRVMLCKARAAVLLRFRGRRLPTLAELRKLTRSKIK